VYPQKRRGANTELEHRRFAGASHFLGRLACKELSIAQVLASLPPLRGFAQELKNKTETAAVSSSTSRSRAVKMALLRLVFDTTALQLFEPGTVEERG
jgi:hypothetical protein